MAAQTEFLTNAKVVRSRSIGKGVTAPQRLTLTDGTVTHDAAFQSVNERKSQADFGNRGRRVQLHRLPPLQPGRLRPGRHARASTG